MKKLFIVSMIILSMACFGCGNKPATVSAPPQVEQKVPPSGRARKTLITPEQAQQNKEDMLKKDSDFHAAFEGAAAQHTELRRKHLKSK